MVFLLLRCDNSNTHSHTHTQAYRLLRMAFPLKEPVGVGGSPSVRVHPRRKLLQGVGKFIFYGFVSVQDVARHRHLQHLLPTQRGWDLRHHQTIEDGGEKSYKPRSKQTNAQQKKKVNH